MAGLMAKLSGLSAPMLPAGKVTDTPLRKAMRMRLQALARIGGVPPMMGAMLAMAVERVSDDELAELVRTIARETSALAALTEG